MTLYNDIITNISTNDIQKIKKEIQDKLDSLAGVTFSKSLSKLNNDELKTILIFDIASMITEVTISAGATRKTEVQFCTNNYHLSEKLDFTSVKDLLLELANSKNNPLEKIELYMSTRAAFYSLLGAKITSNESFLRGLIREMEATDGIVGQGRFSNG